MKEIDGYLDIIDSRDIETRIDYLESLENERDEDEQEELDNIINLRDSVLSSEWKHGLTLINDSYFVDYVRETAEDCGDISRNLPSYIEIDWDSTADNVKVDYSKVEFDGSTFYYFNY